MTWPRFEYVQRRLELGRARRHAMAWTLAGLAMAVLLGVVVGRLIAAQRAIAPSPCAPSEPFVRSRS